MISNVTAVVLSIFYLYLKLKFLNGLKWKELTFREDWTDWTVIVCLFNKSENEFRRHSEFPWQIVHFRNPNFVEHSENVSYIFSNNNNLFKITCLCLLQMSFGQ